MFTIVHYAGAVTYEIDGFLDKNNDLLHNDIAGCLRSSSESFVRLLFAEGGGAQRLSGLTKEALLAKRGPLVKNWKSRWIALRNGKLQ